MTVSIERGFHLVIAAQRRGGYRVALRRGKAPEPKPEEEPAERIPRISRLMALAIHYQGLLDSGVVQDASTLARLAGVTQPRMTQILNLNLLAPDIQEQLLYLDPVSTGKPRISEGQLRVLSQETSWIEQRRRIGVSNGHDGAVNP
jgi:hypothetical protein